MNKLFKKSVAVLASMGVLASTVNVTALGANLVNAEFTEAFKWAVEVGVTTKATEEAFAPFATVSREAIAKMAYNGLNAASCVELKKTRTYANNFSDLASADVTLQESIKTAYEHGLVNGWDGAYHPRVEVSRAQFMTVVGRALYGKLPEGAEYWKNYYKLLNAEGIFTIENANATVKRYEAALVLYRIAQKCKDGSNNTNVDALLCEIMGNKDCGTTKPTNPTTPTNPVTTPEVVRGDVVVSLSSDTPAEQFVAKGRKDLKVMVLDVKADDKEATIKELKVNLVGELKDNEITEVALYNDKGVEIDTDTFSNGEAEFSIDADEFTVAANSTRKLYVTVDIANVLSGDGGRFQLAVGSDDVKGSAKVGGSFPILSKAVTVFNRNSSYKVQLSTDVPSEHSKFKAGEDVEVVDMDIKNLNSKKLELHAVTFTSDYVSGSKYDDDLEKVIEVTKIYVDGDKVDGKVVTDGDKLTITLDKPYKFDEDITLKVEARRVGGEADDMISLVLNQTTDIAITESLTNAYVQVEYTATTGTDDNKGLLAFYTKLGDIESRFDDSSKTPSNGYVNFGAQKEVIFVGSMNLEADAELDGLTVDFDGNIFTATGATVELIEKFELWIDGNRVDSAKWSDVKNATNNKYEFDFKKTYKKGTHTVAVSIDLTDDEDYRDAIDGRTISAKINASDNTNSGEYTSGDDLAFEGAAAGNQMTVRASNVTVTKTSKDGDSDVVEGAKNVNVYAFKVRANDVADLELDKFVIDFDGSAVFSGASTFTVKATYGSNSDTETTNSNNDAVFSSLDWVIKKGETATIKIYADLPSNVNTGNFTVHVRDIQIEDNENDITFTESALGVETFSVRDQAKVTYSTNSANPSTITLVPNMNKEIAVMGLEAEYDDVNVSKLLFTLNGLSGVDYSTVLNTVDLVVDGTVLASASPETVGTGNYLYFNLSSNYKLTKDTVKKLSLVAHTADFDSDDVSSNVGGIKVTFYPGSISSDLETRMVAVNVTSSATVIAAGTFADNMDSVRAATLIATSANATTSLVNGGDLFKFSLTAKGDDAYLSGVKISLTPYGVTPLAMNVEDEGGNLVGTMAADGAVTFTGTYAASGYVISENDTVEFTVIGAVSGINQGDANIRFILSDSDDTVTWGVDGSTFDYDGDDVSGLPTGVTTAK